MCCLSDIVLVLDWRYSDEGKRVYSILFGVTREGSKKGGHLTIYRRTQTRQFTVEDMNETRND